MIPAIIDSRSIRTLLPQSKRHIAAAKNTVNIIAEAPTIVCYQFTWKKYYGRINTGRAGL